MAFVSYDKAKNTDDGAFQMPYGIHTVKLAGITYGTAESGSDFVGMRFERDLKNGKEAVETAFYFTEKTLANDTLNPTTNISHVLRSVGISEDGIEKAFNSAKDLEALGKNLQALLNKSENKELDVLVTNSHSKDKTAVYPTVGPNRPFAAPAGTNKDANVENNTLRFDPTKLRTPIAKPEGVAAKQPAFAGGNGSSASKNLPDFDEEVE